VLSPRHYLQRAAVLAAATGALLGAATGVAAAQPWAKPLQPISVTRAFALPPNPYAAGHRGVDLAGSVGQSVFAAQAGEVSYAASLAGRGVVVVVHGSLRTTYEPVLATVRRGIHVARGQQIGTLESGHAGCPVDACLHWGLLRGQQYLDPMSMLVHQQIRLLPLTGQPQDAAPTHTGSSFPGSISTLQTMTPVASLSPVEPAAITWSVAALAGGGVIFALRRR
jgi:murein DD-endopeptidase MepM/ murein hydrolase activator NlpD